MDIYDIRLANLRDLIGDKSQREFAALVGRSESQLSQYLTRQKNIGDDFARLVEDACGLQKGEIDRPAAQATDMDETALRAVIEALELSLATQKIMLSGARKADLVMALYEAVTGGATLNRSLVDRMITLIAR